MRILVVCGAGASSTFVAQRINAAARRRGLPYAATATDERRLPQDVGRSDLILLGPHLGPRLGPTRELAAPHGVGVLVLDADVFSDLDGTRTLARIETAVRDRSAWPPTATTT